MFDSIGSKIVTEKTLFEDQDKFCGDYSQSFYTAKIFGYSVTLLIAVFNIVLRKINISIIEKIGLNERSENTVLVMKSIFFTTFVNTGLMLLLVNANLKYAPILINRLPLRLQYPDLDNNLYQDISRSLP